MSYKRRDFLKTASVFGSGLVLASLGSNLSGCKAAGSTTGSKGNINAFGLQLYTLRNELPKDPKGVLKEVASYGYKQIEGYEGPQGLFWGMKNTEFKSYLDGIGLNYVSSHCNIYQDFERKADESAAIGMKYLICPILQLERNPNTTLDDYKKAAEHFNRLGQICKERGMRFAYHNHEFTFNPLNGQLPQDVLMQNTDPSLVDYEMDMYWVVTAGQDPIAWFNRYPNRFRLGHVKDRKKDVPLTERSAFTILGTGFVDVPKILKAAKEKGMEYFIIEQDQTGDVPALTAVKENAAYLKNVKL